MTSRSAKRKIKRNATKKNSNQVSPSSQKSSESSPGTDGSSTINNNVHSDTPQKLDFIDSPSEKVMDAPETIKADDSIIEQMNDKRSLSQTRVDSKNFDISTCSTAIDVPEETATLKSIPATPTSDTTTVTGINQEEPSTDDRISEHTITEHKETAIDIDEENVCEEFPDPEEIAIPLPGPEIPPQNSETKQILASLSKRLWKLTPKVLKDGLHHYTPARVSDAIKKFNVDTFFEALGDSSTEAASSSAPLPVFDQQPTNTLSQQKVNVEDIPPIFKLVAFIMMLPVFFMVWPVVVALKYGPTGIRHQVYRFLQL